MKIRYLGHSGFYIYGDDFGILVDPFFSYGSPSKFDYTKEKITHIFVTHAHSDHFGDAPKISKFTNAPIVTVFELANICLKNGINAIGAGSSGKINFDFGSVKIFPSTHTSSLPDKTYAGIAVGFLFEINGKRIYHAGDTGLNSIFDVIGKYYTPDVSLLPIGSYYTMDSEDAVIASKMLNTDIVIPMHYNTFPQIQQDVNAFKNSIEEIGKKCIPLQIDEEIEL